MSRAMVVPERRGSWAARNPGLAQNPWVLEDLLRLIGAYALASALVLASWVGSASTASWSRQVIWLVLSTVAVVVAGWGSGRWLLAGLRRFRRRQGDSASRAIALSRPSLVQGPPRAPSSLLFGPGMTLFHIPSCPLIEGKSLSAMSRRRHEAGGRRPCMVCRP